MLSLMKVAKLYWQISALALVGVPYKFGGSSPMEGMDCSGLAQELMMMAGVMIPTDMTAHQLFEYSRNGGEMGKLDAGTLVFFGKLDKVTHVGVIVDGEMMIEARGGTASTVDLKSAIRDKAFVTTRYYKHRSDFLAAIKPAGLPW